jgi:hypothetical protein
MKTFLFRSATAKRPYFVLLHTEDEPEQAEWDRYVQAIGGMVSAGSERVYAFVATDGGGPNAAQRHELASVVQGSSGAVTHVFTTNSFVRGIVTAFRWIAGGRASAHHPRDFLAVCEQCNLPPAEVLADFIDAQRSFPRVRVLQRIEEAMGQQRLTGQG